MTIIDTKPRSDRTLGHKLLHDDKFTGLKLNLGCGFQHLKGCVNVDVNPNCEPQQVHNLCHYPWPWTSGSVDYVCCVNTLEHLHNLLGVLGEIHRVCKPGARVEFVVPNWSHQAAFEDPTHVRFFGASSWQFWQAKTYEDNTGWYSEDRFNFDLVKVETVLDGPAKKDYEALVKLQALAAGLRMEEAIVGAIVNMFQFYCNSVVRYLVFRLTTAPLPERKEARINVYE